MKARNSPFEWESCEKIRNFWKVRREGAPPPLIRKQLERGLESTARPLIRKQLEGGLEARRPRRANLSPSKWESGSPAALSGSQDQAPGFCRRLLN
jgi:hypothetical protein